MKRKKITRLDEFARDFGFNGNCAIAVKSISLDIERFNFFDLARNEYKDHFYPNNDIDKSLYYGNSKIFIIELIGTDYDSPFSMKIGYFILSPKKSPVENYLDIMLFPEFVGRGLFKFILPNIALLAASMGIEEISFHDSKIAKIDHNALGFIYLDSGDYRDFYSLDVKNTIYKTLYAKCTIFESVKNN